MGLKLYFNPKAVEAQAKQLRILSWAISGIITAAGYQLSNSWVLITSIIIWAALQGCAFMLQSTKVSRVERRKT